MKKISIWFQRCYKALFYGLSWWFFIVWEAYKSEGHEHGRLCQIFVFVGIVFTIIPFAIVKNIYILPEAVLITLMMYLSSGLIAMWSLRDSGGFLPKAVQLSDGRFHPI